MAKYMVVYFNENGVNTVSYEQIGDAEMFAERLLEAGRPCDVMELGDCGVNILYRGIKF